MTEDPPDKARRRFLQAAAATGITAIMAGCNSPTSRGDTPTDAPGGTTDEGPGTTTPPGTPTGRVEQLDAYPRVKVGSLSGLSVGDVKTFSYPLQGQQNFLTRLGEGAWDGVGPDGDVVAFSSRCTHAGCSVGGQVTPEDSRAGPCPCHYTSYDLSKGGIVTMGQSTTDLPQLELEVEGGDIYATYVEGLVWGYHNNLRNGTPIEAAQSN